MKTIVEWKASGLSLERFLKVGDRVDETIRNYFIEVIPPASMTNDCIQMGEPYDSDEKGRDTYLTLHFKPEGWIYVGDKYKNRTISTREPSYR